MSTVRDELDRLGKSIVKDAKKNASKNKKTGRLERSLKYKTTNTGDEKFSVVIEEMYYGKYLNKKTDYMDKAIDANLDDGIESIVDVLTDEILKDI